MRVSPVPSTGAFCPVYPAEPEVSVDMIHGDDRLPSLCAQSGADIEALPVETAVEKTG